MYLILGMGKSGEAARRYCEQQGIAHRCFDRYPTSGVLSDSGPPQLEGVTHLIKSPGVLLEHPWIVAAQERGIVVCTEVDLALPLLKHKTLIGVTGSNGKTTTVLALKQVLGELAAPVGNIGTPLIDAVGISAPILIVELSSFQLETIQAGPWFDCGVVLNITPNHLDYHGTMERYIHAKMELKRCIKPGGLFLTQKEFAPLEETVEKFFKERYRECQDVLYAHDRSNFAATLAISRELGIEDEVFAQRIVHLKKPPHRLEKVGTFEGVVVINDSKATSVDATSKAVAAINQSIVLIVGGVDKGGDFREWLPIFRGKVAHVLAIGEAAERIEREIGGEIPLRRVKTLSEAIDGAKQRIRTGQTLLLSPGCSSYDQFRNYEERGTVFKQLVLEKMGEGGRNEPT